MTNRAIIVCVVSAALLGGCSANRGKEGRWLDADARLAKVHLPNGDCLDLSALPDGWRIAATSTPHLAEFGVPGEQYATGAPRFSILVGVGAPGAGQLDYRTYAEAWLKDDTPSERDRSRDVASFAAYPADDGETVYVGRELDAFMECGVEYGCSIHDGIKGPPIRLNVSIPWKDRAAAAERLMMARRIVEDLKARCS